MSSNIERLELITINEIIVKIEVIATYLHFQNIYL